MRYRVLGPIQLLASSAAAGGAGVGSRSQRTVMATLLAARGAAVPIDLLIDAVWPERPPPTAVGTLRTYVSRLRARVGGDLVSTDGAYALHVRPDDVDAAQFEQLLGAAAGAAPAVAAALLADALALWRGPAFGDRADVGPVRAEARRLEERRSEARTALAGALLSAGRSGEAVAEAEAITTLEPLREEAWAVLIEALGHEHRTAEALRAFHRAGVALAEAGLEPSTRLRATEQLVLRGVAPAPTGPKAPHRFHPRAAMSSLIGRDDDVRRIAELLRHSRLVTLHGTGGVGKTRLALEVAGVVGAERDRGACVVELASVTSGDSVADLVASSLGLGGEGRDAIDVLPLVGALDVLVVLDNAEHVTDAAAAAATLMLSGGPRAVVLVTTRERLGIDGEHVWAVEPLSTVGVAAPAQRLFRERARAVGAAPSATVVTRLARRLDGLPLAIEMAASHLHATSAEELVEELEGRLDELRSMGRPASERHRSLAAVLAWSEARLDGPLARTLAELSVFAGPVTATDIDGVLARPGASEQVRELVSRSLVAIDRTPPSARFRLLQTVRAFAARRLAEAGSTEELGRAHAGWFARVAATVDAELRTDHEAAADARIASILPELRAAHAWASTHDLDLAAAIVAHLHLYAQSRVVDEPLLWAEQLLPQLPVDHPHAPVVLAAAATRALRRGDIRQGRELAAAGVAAAGATAAALPALDALTDAGLFDGGADSAATARALLELAQAQGDGLYSAIAASDIALGALYRGRRDDAAEAATVGLDGPHLPPSGRGWLAYTRGELAQDDDPESALAHYSAALDHARAVNNRFLEGAAIASACAQRARSGPAGDAVPAFVAAVEHWLRLGNTTGQLTTLRNLAVLLHRMEAAEPLAELVGAVERAGPTYGDEAHRLAAARGWAETTLGPARFAALIAEGGARDITAAADAALRTLRVLPRGVPAELPPREPGSPAQPLSERRRPSTADGRRP